jgi:hypothetical protein
MSQCDSATHNAIFGGRDELLRAVFEQYSPVGAIEEFLHHPRGELSDTVQGLYRVIATAVDREPRVVSAMFAEAFSRPRSPAVQSLFSSTGPRMFGVLGLWLDTEVRGGHIRELPPLLLIQQLLDPIMIHLFHAARRRERTRAVIA